MSTTSIAPFTRKTCFAAYERMGWVLSSADLNWNPVDNSKKLQPHSNFKPGSKKTLNYAASGFIIFTGKVSNISVVDLDDLTLPIQKELMVLMADCNAIQQTRKGLHYFYQYDQAIKSSTSPIKHVDTRGDGGCILCFPSAYSVPEEGRVEYIWKRFPEEGETLQLCPPDVMSKLHELGLTRNLSSVPKVAPKATKAAKPTKATKAYEAILDTKKNE